MLEQISGKSPAEGYKSLTQGFPLDKLPAIQKEDFFQQNFEQWQKFPCSALGQKAQDDNFHTCSQI